MSCEVSELVIKRIMMSGGGQLGILLLEEKGIAEIDSQLIGATWLG